MTVNIVARPSYKDSPFYVHEAPVSDLAGRFEGVTIDDGADNEQIHRTVNFFVEMVQLLDRLGWYDHTSDWDFHIGVELVDGRTNNHIGDGATIEWVGEPPTGVYGGEDPRVFVRVGPNFLYEKIELDEDPLKEFRNEQRFTDGDGSEFYYRIPIDKIRKLTWGWCS